MEKMVNVILLSGFKFNEGVYTLSILFKVVIKMNELMVKIGKYCRKFRITELELTLKEVEGGENIKALSSFEHGRSTNINHLLKYVKCCKDREQQLNFLLGIVDIMRDDIE